MTKRIREMEARLDELNERIALLEGVVKKPGPTVAKALESELKSLYSERRYNREQVRRLRYILRTAKEQDQRKNQYRK